MPFYTCMLSRIATEGMMYRHYSWHGFDFTAPMASVRAYRNNRPTCPAGRTDQWWSAVKPGAPHYTLDLREPVEEIISWLEQRAPRYLLTFPSLLYDLVYHPDARKVAGLKIEKVTGISECLTPHVRALVRERLGCEIAQAYACGEMGCIALQSPDDETYYVCEETVLVEILDEAGGPVDPGETGQVVLTSLYNYATPFIRYCIGDFATLAAPCTSGRALMRLKRVDGRPSNALRKLNGGYVWPHQLPMSQFAAHLASPRFQIRQLGGRTLEILTAAEPNCKPSDQTQAAEILSKVLGGAVDLRITPVQELSRTMGGKREMIVSIAA